MFMEKLDLTQRIEAIEERNRKVEADKAWETSLMRRFLVAILTYGVITSFFFVAHLPNPFVNAIVPTLGFLLSTLTVSSVKRWWLKKK
ncbi:MAG: hypothetical protein UV82_C0008G0061 [Candidatus Magasanikbacteria bacterium GW2011_GWD2_43_18]|nr:MAG: hypothetical protein UV18_C0002G0047 [Candidatus Magasanikbacteria bacterium GW2011_GWC2_42_27]KKT04457.1 MAG: hypothetical protein UV82_C0008G0061 [Candidatus Magasanikbacteria bacterium GW2011_GWD2_43_18]KKT26032.1 MAG: hypothetical protein UW10_C0002G0032 [Candidatus Magasanikbacteria bacterium GW2011_GWA2_43_9]